MANIDFCAYETASPWKASRLTASIWPWAKAGLEDFENLVKTIKLGCEAEGDITFPEDFLARTWPARP